MAGSAAAELFAAGFLGAALLAAAVVPLSTRTPVPPRARPGRDHRPFVRRAPAFHATFAGVLAIATALVMVPGVPLLQVLYLSQALNAVLLLGILPLMLRLGRDPAVMGQHVTGRFGQAAG